MDHQLLLKTLEAYRDLHPEQGATVEAFLALVRGHPDCLHRTCLPGHITASAWIVSSDHQRFLLTRHRKLGRWLQLGGHVDGEARAHLAALREAREESGLVSFHIALNEGHLFPLDVDIHRIPARPPEPEHWHYDVRFLLVASPGEAICRSEESEDLRWFERHRFEEMVQEESLHRLGRKAWAALADARTIFWMVPREGGAPGVDQGDPPETPMPTEGWARSQEA